MTDHGETLARIAERMQVLFPKGIAGTDNNGGDYSDLQELWDYTFNKSGKKRKKGKTSASGWYEKAYEYWENPENCPISDDGVLGGFGHLTPTDVRDSNQFLDHLQHRFAFIEYRDIADCGAGIGRVTKNLLLPRAVSSVTLIEQSPRLIESAAAYLGSATEGTRVAYINQGLQDFNPEENTFDLIWIQWVIGHLNDIDFIEFFRRAVRGLKPNGVIILKDNVILDPQVGFCIDVDDNSVCRNIIYTKLLFDLAEIKVIDERPQTDFPPELYPVHMLALVSKQNTNFA